MSLQSIMQKKRVAAWTEKRRQWYVGRLKAAQKMKTNEDSKAAAIVPTCAREVLIPI